MKKYLILGLMLCGAILIAAGTICLTWLSFEYDGMPDEAMLPLCITIFGGIFILSGILIAYFNIDKEN